MQRSGCCRADLFPQMFEMWADLENMLHSLLGVAARAVGSFGKSHPGHVLTKTTVASSQPEDRSLAFAIELVDGVTCWSVVMSVPPRFRMVLLENALDFLVSCWSIWLLHSAALLG